MASDNRLHFKEDAEEDYDNASKCWNLYWKNGCGVMGKKKKGMFLYIQIYCLIIQFKTLSTNK